MTCYTGLKSRQSRAAALSLIQWLVDEGKALPGAFTPWACPVCDRWHISRPSRSRR